MLEKTSIITMEKVSKEKKMKILHIVIIVVGTIFVSLSIFHNNLWFDESYSVSIAKHSFSEIWQIGANDVHPILYYFILHIVGMITNYNIIALRLVSLVSIVLVGVLGYTHIRKDFGEKTGIIFSFLTFFLPVSAEYAGEIRMYALGMFLGTLLGIYAYRLYKGNGSIKNFVIFGLSSLLVSYTHYYGLMLAGIINVLLFIYYIKNRKTMAKELKIFIVTAVIQVVLYLPWLFKFIGQLASVSQGFWISLSFPGTLIEILNMQFVGSLPSTVGLVFALLMFAYLIYVYVKEIKKSEEKIDTKPIKISLSIYVGIILIALIISLIMQSVILLYRYLLIITGLFIFMMSYIISKDKNKYRVIAVCAVILVISICSNIGLMRENYDKSNEEFLTYLEDNIEDDDIILYSDAISGAVVTTYFDNQSYFYDENNWNVEEAYKAYSPYMEIVYDIEDILEEYQGRIVLVEGGDTSTLLDEVTNEVTDLNKNCNLISSQVFNTGYKENTYTIELIEIN